MKNQKSSLLDGTLETHTQGVDSSSTSNNSLMSAKLLKGAKKANSNEEILQYSKVVDENGEPKVVYHGTAYDFNVFDESQSGKSTGNNGWFGKGFYFAPLKSNAHGYAHGASPSCRPIAPAGH